jgi:hypothetical protein
LLAGSKPRGELRHREKMPVDKAGRIVELLQKGSQSRRIGQRQYNIQVHGLVRG